MKNRRSLSCARSNKNAWKIEGKNYQCLYTSADAEPVFVYWKITWVEPATTATPTSTP
jgi:hypothetical protein